MPSWCCNIEIWDVAPGSVKVVHNHWGDSETRNGGQWEQPWWLKCDGCQQCRDPSDWLRIPSGIIFKTLIFLYQNSTLLSTTYSRALVPSSDSYIASLVSREARGNTTPSWGSETCWLLKNFQRSHRTSVKGFQTICHHHSEPGSYSFYRKSRSE